MHIVPAIMTNPDIPNDHHLSRFVSLLPEHNTNNPKLSSLSVEPSEPSTSRGNKTKNQDINLEREREIIKRMKKMNDKPK
jgi:hypothetical protein